MGKHLSVAGRHEIIGMLKAGKSVNEVMKLGKVARSTVFKLKRDYADRNGDLSRWTSASGTGTQPPWGTPGQRTVLTWSKGWRRGGRTFWMRNMWPNAALLRGTGCGARWRPRGPT